MIYVEQGRFKKKKKKTGSEKFRKILKINGYE